MFKPRCIITLSFGEDIRLKNQFKTFWQKAIDRKRIILLFNCLSFSQMLSTQSKSFPHPIVHPGYKYNSLYFPSTQFVNQNTINTCQTAVFAVWDYPVHWRPSLINTTPQPPWQPKMPQYILNTSKECRSILWLRTNPDPSPAPFFPSCPFSGPYNIFPVLQHGSNKVYYSYPSIHLSPLLPAPVYEYLDGRDDTQNSVSYKHSTNVHWKKKMDEINGRYVTQESGPLLRKKWKYILKYAKCWNSFFSTPWN